GDPEPNVRAAVLKQLAEQPTPAMVPRIGEYVATEKDPDLLVHAVRVLGGSRGKNSIACLMSLLEHESWRGAGQAAESLAKHTGRRPDGSGEEIKAEICAALIRLLDDPDGFVVSRAIPGLKTADLAVAVDPLAAVAARLPELAAEVVRSLCAGDVM